MRIDLDSVRDLGAAVVMKIRVGLYTLLCLISPKD